MTDRPKRPTPRDDCAADVDDDVNLSREHARIERQSAADSVRRMDLPGETVIELRYQREDGPGLGTVASEALAAELEAREWETTRPEEVRADE